MLQYEITMSEKRPESGLSKAEINLAYVRIFTWPAVLVVALVLFYQPITEVLGGEFEIEVFGAKFSGTESSLAEDLQERASSLETTVSEISSDLTKTAALNSFLLKQNDSLDSLVTVFYQQQTVAADPSTPAPAPVVRPSSVDQMQQRSVKQERLQTKSKALILSLHEKVSDAQQSINTSSFEEAKKIESQAWEHFLAKRFQKAVASFDKANATFPGFHSAKEISQLLRKHMNELLSTDLSVQEKRYVVLCKVILENYAWELNEPTVAALNTVINSN